MRALEFSIRTISLASYVFPALLGPFSNAEAIADTSLKTEMLAFFSPYPPPIPSSFMYHNKPLSNSSPHFPLLQLTFLRIEGRTHTIYERPIFSGPHTITTASGGTHACTGTNNGAHHSPGNTPTAALDAAAQLGGFGFDATYSAALDDFFVTRIAADAQTTARFWGLLVNGQLAPVGGCQLRTAPWDQILWAYDAFRAVYFLVLYPDTAVLWPGEALRVTVADSVSGVPVAGAEIAGVMTDAGGRAVLSFDSVGVREVKATRADSIRSNKLVVTVV